MIGSLYNASSVFGHSWRLRSTVKKNKNVSASYLNILIHARRLYIESLVPCFSISGYVWGRVCSCVHVAQVYKHLSILTNGVNGVWVLKLGYRGISLHLPFEKESEGI